MEEEQEEEQVEDQVEEQDEEQEEEQAGEQEEEQVEEQEEEQVEDPEASEHKDASTPRKRVVCKDDISLLTSQFMIMIRISHTMVKGIKRTIKPDKKPTLRERLKFKKHALNKVYKETILSKKAKKGGEQLLGLYGTTLLELGDYFGEVSDFKNVLRKHIKSLLVPFLKCMTGAEADAVKRSLKVLETKSKTLKHKSSARNGSARQIKKAQNAYDRSLGQAKDYLVNFTKNNLDEKVKAYVHILEYLHMFYTEGISTTNLFLTKLKKIQEDVEKGPEFVLKFIGKKIKPENEKKAEKIKEYEEKQALQEQALQESILKARAAREEARKKAQEPVSNKKKSNLLKKIFGHKKAKDAETENIEEGEIDPNENNITSDATPPNDDSASAHDLPNENEDDDEWIEYEAIKEYKPKKEPKLTFEVGEILLFKETVNKRWIRCSLKGKTGLVRINYVKRIKKSESTE